MIIEIISPHPVFSNCFHDIALYKFQNRARGKLKTRSITSMEQNINLFCLLYIEKDKRVKRKH